LIGWRSFFAIFRQTDSKNFGSIFVSKSKPTLAETLRKAIEESGETVAALARGSGIPQPVLHRFVSGERDLTLRTADKLLDYFDLELRKRK
jgi:plasmid maintenance system antidote protein VapI